MDIVHRESNVGEESDLYPRVYCICCDSGYASMRGDAFPRIYVLLGFV